jgi:uncharacterized RDD family membrane protein YckC
MRWTDEMRIDTPEQIEVDLELAGLGSRFVAQLIDWFWKVFATAILALLCMIVLGVLGWGNLFDEPTTMFLAVVVTVLYLLWLGYGIYFEVRCNGQTPGKRTAGIRVIQAGGAPIDFRAACIRNLLAVADFLPAFHLLGALLILLSERRQRLGDMAAGTVVTRERVESLGGNPTDDLSAYASEEYTFTPAQLSSLTATDRNLLREFLRRHKGMEEHNWERLACKMAATFREKTGYPLETEITDGATARAFLASLLRDLETMRRHD